MPSAASETACLLTALPETMSTLVIAGSTAKLHKHVLVDTRRVFAALALQPAEFSARYRDAKGQAREVINLPKRECLILVSEYSIEMRARIIDRWLELEAALTGNAASPSSTKRFSDWNLAETRAACAVVSRYDRAYGPAGARWYMESYGFPIPPADLFPPLRQRSFFDPPSTETRQ